MDRFVVLGSANAVAKAGQENTHLFGSTNTRKVLVDCGDNPVGNLAQMGESINEITDLILTHFHADHVGSLPLLIMDMWLEKRQAPLVIHGLEFTLTRAKQLLDLFGWENWKGMFPVRFNVIPDNGADGIIQDESLKVTALPVKHLVPTLGLRFMYASGREISYSCDTEPCENLDVLARNADVLLQESAGEARGHTSAAQAGEIAARANVGKLVLIHYESRSGVEDMLEDAKGTFNGEIVLAQDLMEV